MDLTPRLPLLGLGQDSALPSLYLDRRPEPQESFLPPVSMKASFGPTPPLESLE